MAIDQNIRQQYFTIVNQILAAKPAILSNFSSVLDQIEALKNSLPRSDAQLVYDQITSFRISQCRDPMNNQMVIPSQQAIELFNNTNSETKESLDASVDALNGSIHLVVEFNNKIARVSMPNLQAAITNTPYTDTALTTGITAVVDKSAFAPAYAPLDRAAEVANTLPPNLAVIQHAKIASQRAAVTDAVSNFGRDLGVAKANASLSNTLNVANTGIPMTADQLAALPNPMKVLQDGPAMLDQEHANLCTALTVAAGSFDIQIPANLSPTDAAKFAGERVASFSASIPVKTIPNLADPANPLPNPAYATFEAANASKMLALTALSSSLDTPNPISALVDSGKNAFDSAIANIKAISTLMAISSPVSSSLVSALNNSVDYTRILPTQVRASLTSAPNKADVNPGVNLATIAPP